MTTIAAGATYTARSTWFEYTGGPAVDVAGLTITITRLSDLAVIVATTSTGIVHLSTGLYAYQWTPASDASGDFVLVWTISGGEQASEILTVGLATTVTVEDIVDYIGADAAAKWTTDGGVTYPAISDALAAETVAQLGKVTYRVPTDDVPVPDNSDLLEALKRRVQRNLAMRPLPLSMQGATTDFGPVRIGGIDPEIRRLEAERRKRVVG